MIRGLHVLDPAEVADDEWAGRVRGLQERMAAEGVSVALVYGDVFRSTDIGYLANLCIYWNEGILAVPAEGAPTFLTKLSPRVHTWMRATSKVDDLRSGKAFGPLVAAYLAERTAGVVGLVDRPLWPVDLVGEVTGAATGWDVRALGGLVREQRLVPSPAELALLRDGARVLRRGFDDAARPELPERERVAVLEHRLRGDGFTEVLVNSTSTTLEVTGQYRHGWLHRADPVRPGDAWGRPLAYALDAVLGEVVGGLTSDELTAAASPMLAGLPAGTEWHVICVNQADLATGGEYTTAAAMPLGAVVVVGVELIFRDGGRTATARTVLVGPDGAQSLEDR